jgi:hypothetical protein
MKKLLSLLLLSITISTVSCENSIFLRFSSLNEKIKKIKYENLTKNISFEIEYNKTLKLDLLSNTDYINEDLTNLKIFPNPILTYSNIQIDLLESQNIQLEIFSSHGFKIITTKIFLQKGQHRFKLSGLPKGLYFIVITCKSKSYFQKIISESNTTDILSICYSDFEILDSLKRTFSKPDWNLNADTINTDYSFNDLLRLTAYSENNNIDTIYASPNENQMYSFDFYRFLPVVITDSIFSVGSNFANAAGDVIIDRGSLITERGVCWSTKENPTILDNRTFNGIGAGKFYSSIKNLTPNTQYYTRAYCKNSLGTTYGDEISFVTDSELQDTLNFEKSSNVLFYSGKFDFTQNIWEDLSLQKNNALLVRSNCGTGHEKTELLFSEMLEGNLDDWSINYKGSAKVKLLTNKIVFTKAGTIYDINIINRNNGKRFLYPCSEGILTVFDCSGNSNHISVVGCNLADWSANQQDDFHYNLKNGGGLVLNNDIISNPSFNGDYKNGLAPNWIDYNTVSKSEEQNKVIHNKAQRFKANYEGGIRTTINPNKVKTGCFLKISAWVYVITGKAKANIYGYKSTSQSFLETQSLKTGEWERIEFKTTVCNTPSYDILASVLAANDSSEIIVGEVNIIIESNEIIVPAMENNRLDALNRPLDVSPQTISKVETSIKFPEDNDLINADTKNYLFNVDGRSNHIKLREIPFAYEKMVYKTIFCNINNNKLIIFNSPLVNGVQLNSFFKKWGESSIRVFKNQSEMSTNYLENISVRDVNRNFRVGVINWNRQIVVSSDNGNSWGIPIYYDSQLGVHQIFITSKGSVIIFYKGSIIKRLPLGASQFDEIHPLDEKGNIIKLHEPINSNYPGEYFKPYHKILDIYDSIDDSNLLVWGNWGNNLGAKGASPTGIFYSSDDCKTIKRFYHFGQNSKYTDTGGDVGKNGKLLGNPFNPTITRHVHEVSYNKYNNKIYITCGDDDDRPELHIFETSFNKQNQTWAPLIDLISDNARSQLHRAIGIGFDEDGFMYFGSDGDPLIIKRIGNNYNSQGVYKVHIKEINNISKYILLHDANQIVTNFYMSDNYILFSKYGDFGSVYLSRDKGRSWEIIDISEFSTNWYPFDKFLNPSNSIELIKQDSFNNFFLKTATGTYLNIN